MHRSAVLLVGIVALVGCGEKTTHVEKPASGVHVSAPGVDVQTGDGVKVDAPGVKVDAGGGEGVKVDAPATKVETKP